ncbi:hypothetical protein HYN48_04085 [Flavobacterium magnum]|uniref:Uncharacterized protein n=2 Tax=Flavobacterium magnum TaxID=2162713 RepID=A0A2S0RDZ0_9FLAO|nr:hypothetical protein HYN48_04085 [Flavobacterium magnum]
MISCSKISPGSFWTNFRNPEMISTEINNGPYGGTTEIHWKGKTEITRGEVVQFAEMNGWKFVRKPDSGLSFSNQILERRFGKMENKSIQYFKSDLLTIDEDQGLETQINGFAIITSQNHQLIIYHHWGDF